MKKIFLLLFSVVLMFIFGCNIRVYAYSITPDFVKNYVSENKEKYVQLISNELDEINAVSLRPIYGEIKITEAFQIPDFNRESGKIRDFATDTHYAAVISGNEVIGLLSFIDTPWYTLEEHEIGEDFIYSAFKYISENSNRDITNGISFYNVIPIGDEQTALNGAMLIETKYTVNSDNVSYAVFYDCFDRHYPGRSKGNENVLKLPELTPDYMQISSYNYISSETDYIMKFNYELKDNNIQTDSYHRYYLKTKSEKYLTYQNGKYFLSDYSESENQTFIILPCSDGVSYTIRPTTRKNAAMSRKGDTSMRFAVSYLDGYYLSIGTENENGYYALTETAENDVLFKKYHSGDVKFTNQDWRIEPV